jgi:peptidoglycan/xylan/chitin deacetylase (PgdA/CDA1 family)
MWRMETRSRTHKRARRALLCAGVLGITALAWLAPVPTAARADTPHTIVSLEFDDTWSNATLAQPLLAANGLHATFFINSGFLGRPGRLTLAEAHALADAGNEIAGHTVDHPHLTTLSPADQMREICNDRDTLLADGFVVTDFAYPYGEFNATTAAIVAQCGYNSGRQVSGIGCSGCPTAESTPPPDPYRTRTATGVRATFTLDILEGDVTRAEQSGGGWVQIVFHQICDGCGIYGVTQGELAQFMAWLAPRAANGTTTETVNQVIGGPVNAAVTPPPTPAVDANLAPNPGMEVDADANGTPDCWYLAGFGTNTPTWTRTSDAHTGSFAEQLTITNWTSGDRKAIQPLDQSTCAPTVSPGHTYQTGEWFKSSAPVRFVAYTRSASGAWTFWNKSGTTPAAAGWTYTTWSPPPIPAGTTAISIGLSLASNGTASFDDLQLIGTG